MLKESKQNISFCIGHCQSVPLILPLNDSGFGHYGKFHSLNESSF